MDRRRALDRCTADSRYAGNEHSRDDCSSVARARVAGKRMCAGYWPMNKGKLPLRHWHASAARATTWSWVQGPVEGQTRAIPGKSQNVSMQRGRCSEWRDSKAYRTIEFCPLPPASLNYVVNTNLGADMGFTTGTRDRAIATIAIAASLGVWIMIHALLSAQAGLGSGSGSTRSVAMSLDRLGGQATRTRIPRGRSRGGTRRWTRCNLRRAHLEGSAKLGFSWRGSGGARS